MATLVGKVGIVMKGAWSSSAPYEVLDAVSYNNGLYIAKQAVPANTVPTNTTYWQPAVDGAALLNMFVVENKQFNSVTLADNTEINLDISKDGYTPMGILGIQFPSIDRSKLVGVKQWYVDVSSNTFYMILTMTSTISSGNVHIRILYKEN